MLLDGRARRGDVAASAEERRVALGSGPGGRDVRERLGGVVGRVRARRRPGSPVGPAITKSLVKIAFPNWLLFENPSGDELVLERRGVHDQHARSPGPVLGGLDRGARGRRQVLECVLRELLLELRLDQVRDQPRVIDVAGADDGERRSGVGARERGGHEQGDGGQKSDQGDGEEPASTHRAGHQTAPGRARWRREMEVLRIAGAYRHCICTREARSWGRVRLWRRVGSSGCSRGSPAWRSRYC